MNIIKRFFTVGLTALIYLCSYGNTAFAAEATDITSVSSTNETVYEFDITPEMLTGSEEIMPLSSPVVNQSFTMTTSHRGADRSYSGNTLRYAITVTDANGNPVDNTIAVQLYDYNHSYALKDTRVNADGSTTVISNVSITANRMYYFKYILTAGTTRTLKVQMKIWVS